VEIRGIPVVVYCLSAMYACSVHTEYVEFKEAGSRQTKSKTRILTPTNGKKTRDGST
jgi:hypothetical protein